LNKETQLIENFQTLGTTLGSTLANELNRGQAQNAKDGFLLTYYYSVENNSDEESEDIELNYYLGLVFLHRVDGVDIDIDNLDLKEIEQINLDSLNLGARVNITSFLDESDELEKPISFKIGRGSDVRKFFQEFIGCTEPNDAKADSANLLLALEDVCGQLGFSTEQTKNATDKLQSYCSAILMNGDGQADIINLAGFIFKDEEQRSKFVQIAQNDYQLSEHIGIDKNEINKYDDIIVKTKYYRVSFKDDAINEAVFWDPEKKEITFGDLPEETIEKMNRRFPEIN
jgi:nucleoid-associated protein